MGRSNKRVVLWALSTVAVATLALALFTRSKRATSATTPSSPSAADAETVRELQQQALASASGVEVAMALPTNAQAFERVPEDHRPAHMHMAALSMQAWLMEPTPKRLDGQIVRLDCSEVPCLLEIDISEAAEEEVSVDDMLMTKLVDVFMAQAPQIEHVAGLPGRTRVFIHYNPAAIGDSHYASYEQSVKDRVEELTAETL